MSLRSNASNWPALPYEAAGATYTTLHLWTQIVGKIVLAKMPWINHSWHVTLFVTPFGLTTRTVTAGEKHFQIDFDLQRHRLRLAISGMEEQSFSLENLSVAGFYHSIMGILSEGGIECSIYPIPNELEDPIPLDRDETHRTYNSRYAEDLHRVWLSTHGVFTRFRSEFLGKCSPVHLFWGGFDLVVTRFSGREASAHPGGFPNLPDWVAREAYSHEVCSCGFWPGSEALPEAAFYCYIYPEPEGFSTASVTPDAAYYHQELGEYILPYTEVAAAGDPAGMLLEFLNSTYDRATELAEWDTDGLRFERDQLLP